jgi:hypothetical protein
MVSIARLDRKPDAKPTAMFAWSWCRLEGNWSTHMRAASANVISSSGARKRESR